MSTELATKLARLVVHYSLAVQPGETIAIEGSTEAIPLVNEIYRQVLHAGGHPLSRIEIPGQRYIFMTEAQDHQLAYENPYDLHLIETLDGAVKIASDVNTHELANIPPERMRRAAEAQARFMTTLRERGSRGELKFCYLPWPTAGLAQAAKMSTDEFAVLVEATCFLDLPDPAGEWRRLAAEQQRLCDTLETVDRLRIVSTGTDLTLSVRGRKWINCHGKSDLPDGEIFTGPLEDSANGTISFTFPGRRVEGIVLTFREGEVVDHAADKGADHLGAMLQIPGANRLGEIGIGTNFGHQTYVNHILFDEKMGGTLHLALGGGFPESGSRNVSGLHWDMLLDLRQEGRIYADGNLIYETGRFLI